MRTRGARLTVSHPYRDLRGLGVLVAAALTALAMAGVVGVIFTPR